MAKKNKTASATTVPDTGNSVSARPTENGNKVTVAFNSPRGIIFNIKGKAVHINGNNAHLAGKEKGVIPVGRYGYTRIDSSDWEAIQAAYGSMAIFVNGLIFVEKTKDRAEDRAEEQAELRHGLEPVDPEQTATTAVEDPGNE